MKNENIGALLAAASSALSAVKVMGPQLSIRHQQQVILMDRLLREMSSAHPCEQEYRAVAYFGRVYYLPKTVTHLATDECGTVFAFDDKPEYYVGLGTWHGSNYWEVEARDDLDAATSLVEIDA